MRDGRTTDLWPGDQIRKASATASLTTLPLSWCHHLRSAAGSSEMQRKRPRGEAERGRGRRERPQGRAASPQQSCAAPARSGTGGIVSYLGWLCHRAATHAPLGASRALTCSAPAWEAGRPPSEGFLWQDSSFPPSPQWLSLKLRGRLADFLLSGSPAPRSGSDKLVVFSLRASVASRPSLPGSKGTRPHHL